MMNEPRFLIVDDLEDNRRLFRRLVQSHFKTAEIEVASNGQDALDHIAAHPIDILVLDAMMPGIDGFEVCRRIKASPDTQSVLVLMVSGQLIDPADRVSGLDSGADSYLCKPFENPELIAQLRALVRIRHFERELQAQKKRLEEELQRRTEMERALKKAKDTAESAMRTKSEFLAHMSHEIRTPMNAVIGMTEILLDSSLTETQEECVRTIHGAGETLLMVINDILDYSKLESGKVRLEDLPFRLDELMEDALKMIEKQAGDKGLEVRAHMAQGTPPSVVGDTVRLRQILVNLLSNAVKFTEKGSIRLEVSGHQTDAQAWEFVLSVRDTGLGIPQEKMSRLFRSFSQVDDSTTRRFGGTGLGLVISRRLAELMGGTIIAESEEGTGSVFHVQVPLKPAPATPGASDAAVPEKEPREGAEISRLRVLVAEDNAVNRKVAEMMLTRLGCRVAFAENGEEALAAVLREPFDIVLMDIQMPGMDGVEATRRIHAECSPARCPRIVALTAHAMQGDREKYLAAGMDDYISKPIREKELRRALERNGPNPGPREVGSE